MFGVPRSEQERTMEEVEMINDMNYSIRFRLHIYYGILFLVTFDCARVLTHCILGALDENKQR